MSLASVKLSMLKKNLEQKEEQLRLEGSVTSVVENDFKERIDSLMDKIRTI